jgi:hypothetical protein
MSYTIECIGLDEDIKISLKEKGLVCRNERSDEYFCVYKKSNNFYDYSFLYESEIIELMEEKSWLSKIQINSFLNFCGLSLESFYKLSFAHKVHNLISYFSIQDIMGISFNDLTFQEAYNLIDESHTIIPFKP